MRQRMRLLALGDSVTVGSGFSGVTDSTSYVQLLREQVESAELNLEVISSSLEGIDTGYALKRFNRMVTVHEPDVVTIMLGLNDALPPGARPPLSPEEYQQNLLGLVDRVLAIEAQPILACPNPRFSLADDERCDTYDFIEPYVEVAQEVADHYQIGFINVYQSFRQFGQTRDLSEIIPDGIHPDPTGHRIIANTFAEYLIPAFGGTLVGFGDFAATDVKGEEFVEEFSSMDHGSLPFLSEDDE